MFSQDSDIYSQNYHTSVSQRFSAPELNMMNTNNNNNNNNSLDDIAVLTDGFAQAVVQASIAMGGEEVGADSHLNASQMIASSSQQQQSNNRITTATKMSPYEIALVRYCDGTWHTQQYLSSTSADERRRHALLAAQSFQQSLDNDEHFAFSHYGAGLMNLLEKNYTAAFTNTRQALLKMGTHCPNMARFVLGISALQLDRPDIAEKCFNRIISISNGADPLGHIGSFLASIRKRDIVGIAESLLSLTDTIPQLPVELIQKSADMIYLQCWPTPGSAANNKEQFNPNIIRQKIVQVSPTLLRIIGQSRNHPSCTTELAAYADYQEGRLRAALAIQAPSDTAAGLVDKEEMAEAQRLLYRGSRHVIPAIPHLVRATYHALGKESALIEALQGFNRMAKLGLVPFRELFEMTTVLLTLNHQPEAAVRMAKQLVDTIGLANSEAWFNASFVNRLDQKTCQEQAKQAISIEETIKDGAAASGSSLVCTSGEDESRINVNLASLAPHYDYQGAEDPADPLNMLLSGSSGLEGVDLKAMCSDSYNSTGVSSPPSSEVLPVIFNFGLLNEARGNKKEAVRIYIALIKWFPHEQSPYFRLANIALENEDVWTCIKWMQLCISISKPEFKAQCFSMMARALSTSGTAGNATAYRLLTSDEGKAVLEASGPQQQAVLYACAGACLAHDAQGGQHIQMKAGAALRLFRQSLKLDPNSSAAAHGIACCVALLGASEQSSAILERITSERCPDVGITKYAAENLFNAYINTSAHRQALRMEQLRQEAYPTARVARDRANAIICALLLTQRSKEALDRVLSLVKDYPRHALTNFTAVLVTMAHVLSCVESMSNMPKTEEEATEMTGLIESAIKWAGLATQLKDKPEATDFVRRLISYTKKLELRQVVNRFVDRAQKDAAKVADWQDEWRAENTQRTREAEEQARLAREAAEAAEAAENENNNNNMMMMNNNSQDAALLADQQRTMNLRYQLLSQGSGGSVDNLNNAPVNAGYHHNQEYTEEELNQMIANGAGAAAAQYYGNSQQAADAELLAAFDTGNNNSGYNNAVGDDIRRRQREEDTSNSNNNVNQTDEEAVAADVDELLLLANSQEEQ